LKCDFCDKEYTAKGFKEEVIINLNQEEKTFDNINHAALWLSMEAAKKSDLESKEILPNQKWAKEQQR